MASRPGLRPNSNKRGSYESFLQTSMVANGKRPKADYPSTSRDETGSSSSGMDGLRNRLDSFNGEVDDSFFELQKDAILQLEDQYTQQNRMVRETVALACDYNSRPLVQPRLNAVLEERQAQSSNTENSPDLDLERYVLIDEVRKPLEWYHLEKIRCGRKKNYLEKQLKEKDGEIEKLNERLLTYDGEIKLAREQKISASRENARLRLEFNKAEQQQRMQLAAIEKKHTQEITKLKSELQFLKQEKDEILEQLRQLKARQTLQSQQIADSGGCPQKALAAPAVNGNVRRSANGPGFPSRNTFYNDDTQPLLSRSPLRKRPEIAAENERHVDDLLDGHAQQEPMEVDNLAETIITVNREVQTDMGMFRPLSPAVPPPVPSRFVLTRRLRANKPEIYRRDSTAARIEAAIVGSILERKLQLAT